MTTAIVAFAVLVIAMLIGVPIPFAFFASALTVVYLGGYDYAFLLPYGYSQTGAIVLVAIPLFILAGKLMEKSGIGETLVNLVSLFVGRFKSGLGTVMVLSCLAFASVSGSGFATLSCIGSIMLPRMYQAGYPKGISSALISSAALLGLLTPPSVTLILFAFVGGQSVLASFLAPVIPAGILVILLIATNAWLLRKDPNIKVVEKMPPRVYRLELGKRSANAIPAMIAPIIILGGIYGGFLTPTEAAAVAVVYSIPVGWFFYKGLNGRAFKESLIAAGSTAGVVMIMLFTVSILSRLYVMEDVPRMLLNAMTSVTDNRILLIMMINLFLVAVASVMDDISAILLTTPIILPVAIELGIHPIHYAAIMGVNLGMGCVLPPCAPFLYLGSRVGGASVNEMLKPTGWFILLAWVPTLIITTYIPEIALFLPRLAGLI